MKKKVSLLAATLLLAVFCGVTLAGCGTDYSKYVGKYYQYTGDVKNESEWVELKADKKWTDDAQTGTYTINGDKIKFIVDGAGNALELNGTIKDGVLTLGAATFKKD